MATPITFVAAGAILGTTDSDTITAPSHNVDDILLLHLEGEGEDTSDDPIPTGWTLVDSVASATDGANDRTRHTLAWRRAESGDDTWTISDDGGNHAIGVITAWRGCVASGNPIHVFGISADGNNRKVIDVPGITTTIANCMIVVSLSAGDNFVAGDYFRLPVNSNFADPAITESHDLSSSAGTDGALGGFYGGLAVAGACGESTFTGEQFEESGEIIIALEPASAGAEFTQTVAVTRTRAAAQIKSIAKAFALTRTRSIGIVKQAAKAFSLTSTRAAALSKQTSKTFVTTRTRSVILSTIFIQVITIAVTRIRSVALLRAAAKTFSLTRTRSAVVSKQTSKTFSTTRTRSAGIAKKTLLAFTVTRVRSAVAAGVKLATQLIAVTRTRAAVTTQIPTFAQAVAVTRTRTAALAKLIGKTLAVTRARTAAVIKKTLKTFSLTRTRAAVVSAVLLAVQVISVTRTRTIATATVFTAGGPGGVLAFYRRFRAWRRHR